MKAGNVYQMVKQSSRRNGERLRIKEVRENDTLIMTDVNTGTDVCVRITEERLVGLGWVLLPRVRDVFFNYEAFEPGVVREVNARGGVYMGLSDQEIPLEKFWENWTFIESGPKPPPGLTPRKIHDEARVSDIMAAIDRYTAAGKTVPAEWLIELVERCKQ